MAYSEKVLDLEFDLNGKLVRKVNEFAIGDPQAYAARMAASPKKAKEAKLREEYKTKLTKAVNLDVLKKQREQVQQYVTQLEKQLPSKAEMDALLSDINQAGLGRSLQFDLFRPGQVVVRDYYAELPISLRVTGRYHDIGAFAWLSWQAMVCSLELPRIWAYFAPAEPGGTGNCIRVGRRPEQDTRRCEAGLDREMLGARL